MSFINTVLEDSEFETIQSVDIQNPFNLKNYLSDKKSILDIKARDQKGRIYDIEVQSTGDRSFVNRSLYYWARLYASQLTEGERYRTLRPTICINLLNFEIFSEISKAHSCFLLHEREDKDLVLTDHLQLHFVELPKLKKSERLNKLEKWIYYLLNEGKEDPVMKILIKDDEDIAKAHEVYNHFTQDDQMRDAYEARQKWLKDYNSAIADAEEKGMEKGVEKVALKMLSLGLSKEEIAQFTGLSIEEINQLTLD